MNKHNDRATALYIHVPFCKRICPYCDFVKYCKNKTFEEKYIDNLIVDIKGLIEQGCKFETIYIGGGTPTCLEYENLERLLINLKPLIDFSKNFEFTIECNPENITEKLLILLKDNNINRISIGIQSFNKEILTLIKRDYDLDIFKLINLVKSFINNISVDLMYGFPNQTLEDLENDLNEFLKLDVPHISTYSLTVEKGTLFYRNKIKPIDSYDIRDYYDLILNTLRKHGYRRYEVANFARPGYESAHNITYWKNKEYVGIGLGAAGYDFESRYKYIGSLKDYLAGNRYYEEDVMNEYIRYEDFILTNLRLEEGFLRQDFINIFGKDIYDVKKDTIDSLTDLELLELTKDRLRCTDNGLALLDFVLEKMFTVYDL